MRNRWQIVYTAESAPSRGWAVARQLEAVELQILNEALKGDNNNQV